MPSKTAKKLRKRAKKVAKQELKKAAVAARVAEAAPAIVAMKGSGDYVPSKFRRLKGNGGYFSDLLGGIGGGVGGLVDTGTSLFKAITGSGKYRSRSAAAQSVYSKEGLGKAFMGLNPGPVFSSGVDIAPLNMGDMNVQFAGAPPRVQHREFIASVYGSVDFATTQYRIQPGFRGFGTLFPWLSSIARNFKQYKLHGAVLEYVKRRSEYSTTGELGSVMMSTQYDVTQDPLANEAAVDNNEFTTTADSATSFIHPIECSPAENPIMLRSVRASNTNVTGQDNRLDDVGNFQISTIGQPDTGHIGDLWITYDIEFFKPVLPDKHEGTTYLLHCEGVAGHSDSTWGSYSQTENANNSLPVVATKTDSGGSSVLTLQLPEGYAGSYMAVLSFATDALDTDGAVHNLGWTLSLQGSDITQIALWDCWNIGDNTLVPLGQAIVKEVFQDARVADTTTYYGARSMKVITFSTIAATAANNQLVFIMPQNDDDNLRATVLITAMDNDISSLLNASLPKSLQAFEQQYAAQLSEMRDQIRALSSRLAVAEAKQPESASTTPAVRVPTPAVLIADSASSPAPARMSDSTVFRLGSAFAQAMKTVQG